MCVGFWFGVKLRVKLSGFPEKFDTIATCVLSFFSKPLYPAVEILCNVFPHRATIGCFTEHFSSFTADERQDRRTFRD